MGEYTIHILWNEQERCYVATSPELGDLSAVGSSAKEAFARFECIVRVAAQLRRESGQARLQPRQVHERYVERGV